MPSREVIQGRRTLYSDPFQRDPLDHFHHHLHQILSSASPSPCWPGLQSAHQALIGSPAIPLHTRLAWSPLAAVAAPGSGGPAGKRLLTLGRLVLDGTPTRSFWVVHEVRGKAYAGVWCAGWVNNMLGFSRDLERRWWAGGRGAKEDWSVGTSVGEVPEDLMKSLEAELLATPSDGTSSSDHGPASTRPATLTTQDPLTPPHSPGSSGPAAAALPFATMTTTTTTTTTTLQFVSQAEYAAMPAADQREYRARIERAKARIEAELRDLAEADANGGGGGGPPATTVASETAPASKSDAVPAVTVAARVGAGHDVPGAPTTNMSLAESFLARHLSGNMLRYLKGIGRATAEACRVSDRSLDDAVAKKFRAR